MRYLGHLLVLMLLWLFCPGCRAETMTIREYAGRWAYYYSNLYGVPAEFVEAVIQVESNWNPTAVSPKGARGLMQLMPKTAARFQVTDAFAIPENIRGGVAYLAVLMRLFEGDLRLVTAAYMAGENRILARRLEYSSGEVFQYVVRVLAVYRAKLADKRQPGVQTQQAGSDGGAKCSGA